MVSFGFFLIVSLSWASHDVMVHLFEWKWTDVAKECTEFLGPRGYSAVQISPPNEHAILPGFPWYQRYQPVSYQLQSRSGSPVEFADMVQTCAAAGVDIYADVVINHMAASGSSIGSAGSRFSLFNYPDYSYSDFHHCNRYGDDNIQNYQDAWEVQNCQLLGLPDLDTDAVSVQDKIANYLNHLLQIGVAGFRIDAAKHISSENLKSILQKVNLPSYMYQEVIDTGGEPIKAFDYLQNGAVTEFKYGLTLASIFTQGQLAWLNNQNPFGEAWGLLPSEQAIVFLDNHDNQRGHGAGGSVLTHKDPRVYQMAMVFVLAWPYGYPQVMSSYAFSDPSQGPPADALGNTADVQCGTDWVCEHRWPVIANMVEFRQITANEPVINWWSNGNNQIAFSRGTKGFVVINNEDSLMDISLSTSLPSGDYCDVADDNPIDSGCPIHWIRVEKDAKTRFILPARTAAVIHVGRKK